MTNRRPRFGLIERLAEKLVLEANIAAPPVPVDRIAIAQGCIIKPSDLMDISGVLVRAPNAKPVIGVNRTQPENRRRFTIAHELGHLLLHHDGQEVTFDKDFRVSLRSDESSLGTNVEEVEANFFAASLLMPASLLGIDPRAHSIELEQVEDIAELATAYRVSNQAMTLRLARLIDRRGRTALAGKQARFYF